jgi:hypothetical protein
VTIRHVLIITAFCFRIYRAGRIISSIELSCNLFEIVPVVDSTSGIIHVVDSTSGIIHVVDSTNGIIHAVISRHILLRSAFKPVSFLEPLDDGGLKVVTVTNCCIY